MYFSDRRYQSDKNWAKHLGKEKAKRHAKNKIARQTRKAQRGK